MLSLFSGNIYYYLEILVICISLYVTHMFTDLSSEGEKGLKMTNLHATYSSMDFQVILNRHLSVKIHIIEIKYRILTFCLKLKHGRWYCQGKR